MEDGRVTHLTGDREHPASGGFICPKGTGALELLYHPQRLHRPLKRRGPRGSGDWQEIPWDQALDEIAAEIRRLTAAYGPETLAYAFGTFHGADFGIGQRFLNLFGSPNTVGQDKICYGPAALGEALTYGFGPSFMSFPVPGTTRCLVIWGMRPSASTPLLWRRILQAQRAGAKLIVIDPERGREADAADLWLQNRPGTDAALALSFIHCIIEEGLYDAEFVEAQTTGFAGLRARAAQYPPGEVAEFTGVPAARIVEAARMYADCVPGIIHAGNGICQSGRSSVQCARAIACLVAITGNVNVPGGHFLVGPPPHLLANGDAIASSALPERQRAKKLGADRFPFLGSGYAPFEAALSRAWHGRRDIFNWLSSAHQPTLWRAITEGRPYPVKALIVQHHNPVGASANSGAAAAALADPKLELFVAHDLFLTATSRLADYVLPAAHWLEKPFFSMGLGYIGFAGDFAEVRRAVLPPEHEHRSDYDFWRDLARRLGQGEHWPDTAEEFWSRCLEPAGLDFAAAAAHDRPLFPDDFPCNAGAPPMDPGPRPWGTPSGKIELHSSLMKEWGQDPLPAFEWPAVLAGNGDFPLVLTTGGREIDGFHQDAQHMRRFRRKFPDPVVSLHPRTAAETGVGEGDWAWIETPVGKVRQKVRVTEDLAPGVVHADRWWYPERQGDATDPFGWRGTNINMCTDDAPESCDPVLGTWLLRGLPCRIVPDTAGQE